MRHRTATDKDHQTWSWASRFRNLDVYSKVHDDYRVKTQSGGFISLVAILTMAILLFSELRTYLTVEVVDHIIVDTSLGQKLAIGMNITFPRLRCDEVSVDTVDSMGENQVNVAGDLVKLNLDAMGLPTQGDVPATDGACLSCMEAGTEGQCCNSCQDLKDAYLDANLPYNHILDTAVQCKSSVGCRVHGDVEVSKVAGNVHVALGKSTVRDGKHIHEFNIKEVNDGFNTSHEIHRLDFGDHVNGVLSPLAGSAKIVNHGAYMFHYYIKLVPTLFLDGERAVYTHQYSVTAQEKNVLLRPGELSGLPGVFLVYEFTPFMVQKIERKVPLSHFLTSCCAIMGGVFTVAGVIDRVLYKSYRLTRPHGRVA
mmetsp:Transcript_55690/g.120327  ORF Transcript_55690/g.120327 Transcript_55690/m.120327 type:complete len:368 (-) Transcript_55690:189-1292(-)